MRVKGWGALGGIATIVIMTAACAGTAHAPPPVATAPPAMSATPAPAPATSTAAPQTGAPLTNYSPPQISLSRDPEQCDDGDCALEVTSTVVLRLDPSLGFGPVTVAPSTEGVTILGVDAGTSQNRGCPEPVDIDVSVPGMGTDVPVTLESPTGNSLGGCRSERGLVFLAQEQHDGHPVLRLYRIPPG